MKRLMMLAALVYPRSWRQRYGEAFDALIEDSPATWGNAFNIVAKGFEMQLTSRNALTFCVAAGLTLGLAYWVLRDPGYAVQTSINVKGETVKTVTTALTRRSLSELIAELKLYPDELRRKPVEAIIEDMRGDIRISRITSSPGNRVEVAFRYPDRALAEQTVVRLVSMLGEQTAPVSASTAPRGPAYLPLLLGALAGLAVSLFFTPKGRRVFLHGAAGAAAGAALAYVIPGPYRSDALVSAEAFDPAPVAFESIRLSKPGADSEWAKHLRITTTYPGSQRFVIDYKDSDPLTAQRTLAHATTAIVKAGGELIDSPSYPQRPAGQRTVMFPIAGLAMGGLLGLRPRLKRAPTASAGLSK